MIGDSLKVVIGISLDVQHADGGYLLLVKSSSNLTEKKWKMESGCKSRLGKEI